MYVPTCAAIIHYMHKLPDEYACSAVLYDVLGTSLLDESSQLGEIGGDGGSSKTFSSACLLYTSRCV